MSSKFTHLFFYYITLIATLLVLSTECAAADNKELADRSLKISGVFGQLEDLGNAVISAIPADALPNPAVRSEAAALIKKVASTGTMKEMLQSIVASEVETAFLQQVNAFYDSNLGRKIAKIHETALDPANLKNIRESRKLLATLDEQRTNILREMVNLEGFTDTSSRLLELVIKGLLEGSLGSSQETQAQARQLIDSYKIIERFMGSGRVDDTAMMAYAYNYRQFDDKDLQSYLHFLKTDASRQFSDAVKKGLDSAVFSIAKAIGESTARTKNQ